MAKVELWEGVALEHCQDQENDWVEEMNIIEIAAKAVQTYAEMHPRPSQVSCGQACEMLGVSRPTLRAIIRRGEIKLTAFGLIPVSEIDRVLAVRGDR